ncbi:MAG: coenzyme F420-0:L-glutamate ligase [Candidatus Asgardarchaeia archaeon]
MKISIWPLVLPTVRRGYSLAELILEAMRREGEEIKNNDIVIVSSKIVSKAYGGVVSNKFRYSKVSIRARLLSKITGRDPFEIELIKRNSKSMITFTRISLKDLSEDPIRVAYRRDLKRLSNLLGRRNPVFITVSKDGRISTDSGVDSSNVKDGYSIPPENCDKIAKEIRDEIYRLSGNDVGVVIADSEGRILRRGTVGIAVGTSGVKVLENNCGAPDRYGNPKVNGWRAIADLIASLGVLVMGETNENCPAVVIRGLFVRGVGNSRILSYNYNEVKSKFIKAIFNYLLMKFLLL